MHRALLLTVCMLVPVSVMGLGTDRGPEDDMLCREYFFSQIDDPGDRPSAQDARDAADELKRTIVNFEFRKGGQTDVPETQPQGSYCVDGGGVCVIDVRTSTDVEIDVQAKASAWAFILWGQAKAEVEGGTTVTTDVVTKASCSGTAEFQWDFWGGVLRQGLIRQNADHNGGHAMYECQYDGVVNQRCPTIAYGLQWDAVEQVVGEFESLDINMNGMWSNHLLTEGLEVAGNMLRSDGPPSMHWGVNIPVIDGGQLAQRPTSVLDVL